MKSKFNTITAIVAEDDEVIRNLLVEYLESFEEVEVVSAVASGSEMMVEAARLRPVMVLLDICLPDESGLTLANRLREVLPEIFRVFTTGYTEYAAEAFALEATDYLVKPVSRDRLARTIDRVKNQLLIRGQWKHQEAQQVLTINEGHHVYFVHPGDIIYIEKKGRKSVIHTRQHQYYTGESLQSVHARLGPNFFRCHKSFIINIHELEIIYPIGDRLYKVGFRHDYPSEVTMGRQAYEALYERFAFIDLTSS